MFQHNIEESSSKLEVSQNHKSVEDNSHISKRRKSVVDKSPAKIVSPVIFSRYFVNIVSYSFLFIPF